MSKETVKPDDRELIERFNNGDQEAFETLVTRHSQRAYQIAYGVLRNPEDAQEVAQDVFVRVYKALGSFRGDSEFTTWMYRIAMNLARNKYRWKRCRGFQKEFSIDATLESDDGSSIKYELPETRLGPDEETDLQEFTDRINKELYNLPELYREALVLRNVENLSYEQIADILGCKLGTIKSRIARAREELRKRLQL